MNTYRALLSRIAPGGLAAACALGLVSCGSPMLELPVFDDPQLKTQQPTGPAYGIDHDDILDNVGDVFKDGRQVPPAEGERLHSCGKLRYKTVGAILTSRGINIGNTAANSAGSLYQRAQSVWGTANFFGRIGESTRNSTSSVVGLQDILLAVAEELVTATNADGAWMSGACSGGKLFSGTSCDRDGFACLLGATPSQRQLDLCNNMVADTAAGVTDALTRKRLAVAAIASTIFLCD